MFLEHCVTRFSNIFTTFKKKFLIISISPFSYLALGIATGISLAHYVPELWHASYNTLLLLIFACTPKISKRFLQVACIIFAGISIGFIRYYQDRMQLQWTAQQCSYFSNIEGYIIDIVPTEKSFAHYRLTLDLTRGFDKKNTQWRLLSTKIHLYVRKKPTVLVGDYIRCLGVAVKQTKNESFGIFLWRNNIISTAFFVELPYLLLNRPLLSTSRYLHQTRGHFCNSMRKRLNANTLALLHSLFLGDRETCKLEQSQHVTLFGTWGIMHFIARAGLHLTIFISLLIALFRFIPLPFFVKQLLLLFLACIYYLLTWSSLPFLRAFSMHVMQNICSLLRLSPHPLHLLSITCSVFLVKNPVQLFSLDFQLTFIITAAIYWLNLLYHKEHSMRAPKILQKTKEFP